MAFGDVEDPTVPPSVLYPDLFEALGGRRRRLFGGLQRSALPHIQPFFYSENAATPVRAPDSHSSVFSWLVDPRRQAEKLPLRSSVLSVMTEEVQGVMGTQICHLCR